MTTTPDGPPARKRRRRLLLLPLFLGLALVALLAALPYWLSSAGGRRWLIAQADAALAPGRLEVGSMSFSWFGPTRLGAVVLRDHQGDPVVTAESGDWDRNLRQFLLEAPRLGVLSLHGARLDLAREPSGKLNLLEVLEPILKPNPRTELTIHANGASLRLRSPELASPVVAERTDATIELPLNLGPSRWTLALANGDDETVAVYAELDRIRDKPAREQHLLIDLKSRRWPLAVAKDGMALGFRSGGHVRVERHKGNLAATGALDLTEFDAALAVRGDRHLKLDKVALGLDVAQDGDHWNIRKLDATSAIGGLTATGTYPPSKDDSLRADGSLDLPALLRQWPGLLELREGLVLERGTARIHLEARPEADRQLIDAEAVLADIKAQAGARSIAYDEPATLKASFERTEESIAVRRLSAKTAFLDLAGKGDLVEGVTLAGTIDLAGLMTYLGDFVDLGDLELAGAGGITAEYRPKAGAYFGQVRADLRDVALAGVPLVTLDEPEWHFHAEARGATADSGLPNGLSTWAVALDSPSMHAAVEAAETFHASLELPIRSKSRSGKLAAAADGRWSGRTLDLGDIRLEGRPDGADATPVVLAFSAIYDAEQGRIDLKPRPGSTGAVVLAPGGLAIEGLGGDSFGIEGGLQGDFRAIATAYGQWTGTEPLDLAGSWSSGLSVHRVGKAYEIRANLEAPDLSGPATELGRRRVEIPLNLWLLADYDPDADHLELKDAGLAGTVATVHARGQVGEARTRRVADLSGEFEVDDSLLQRFLAANVEPEAKIALRPRPFHVKGPLAGPSTAAILRGLDAEAGVDVVGLDVFGMKFGTMPLVARIGEGQVAIEPIRTELNGGVLDLRPALDLDDPRGAVFVLANGSGFTAAQINEDVSRRVLSYAAPVLYGATSVRGILSARIDGAEFPLEGDLANGIAVQGHLIFQDTAFTAGPLGRQLLGLVRKPDLVLLRLNQDVPFQVDNGRVYQPGMAIPLANLASIDVVGSVGFDRTLDLAVGVPIVPDALDRVPIVGDVVGGLKIKIPVTGTLADPKIDKESFDAGMKQMGRDVAGRGAALGGGVVDMIRDIGRLFPKRRNAEPAPDPGPMPPPNPRRRFPR